MNIEYKGRLSCDCCTSNCNSESNHDETHVRCMYCLRESLGGYEELVLLNRHRRENNKTQVDASIILQVLQEINRPFKMN